MAKHTPGPWRVGTTGGAVVSDTPVRAPLIPSDQGEVSYYGGYLVAESIAPRNRVLIAAAPELLAACKAAVMCIERGDTSTAALLLRVAIDRAKSKGADNA